MPNGQYKPIPRAEPEQLKPFVIKPNMPHKQNKRKFTVTAPGIAANPAYIKVCLANGLPTSSHGVHVDHVLSIPHVMCLTGVAHKLKTAYKLPVSASLLAFRFRMQASLSQL